jgi:hypothetical protein
MQQKITKSKVTYSSHFVIVMILKEAFKRDLRLFTDLLADQYYGKQAGGSTRFPEPGPDWTYTVITDERGNSELMINVPSPKQRTVTKEVKTKPDIKSKR